MSVSQGRSESMSKLIFSFYFSLFLDSASNRSETRGGFSFLSAMKYTCILWYEITNMAKNFISALFWLLLTCWFFWYAIVVLLINHSTSGCPIGHQTAQRPRDVLFYGFQSFSESYSVIWSPSANAVRFEVPYILSQKTTRYKNTLVVRRKTSNQEVGFETTLVLFAVNPWLYF